MNINEKLNWNELKNVVNDVRRQLSNLSTVVPSAVSFRTLQDGRIRIYFLSTPQNAWETTLLYADVPDTSHANNIRLQWQGVIESNFPSLSANIKFSREEQLLWERKRVATWGINAYEINCDSGKIIFPAGTNLFQCVDSGFSVGPLFPTRLRLSSTGAKMSPQICPCNADLVAYICNHDIWVTHTTSGCNVRLTYAHKGGTHSLADDPLSAGVPSYVMQEEFSRYQGYWWQPKCTSDVYRILYEEVDDSDVKIYCFPSSQPDCYYNGETEEFRFPRAGCANSKSNLKMIEFQINSEQQITNISMLELHFPLSMLFPWMEYIVRMDWTPDSQYIWAQLLDRRQQRLDLVLIPLSSFTETLSLYEDIRSSPLKSDNPDSCLLDASLSSSKVYGGQSQPIVQIIYSQESSIWVNVNDILYFLSSSTSAMHTSVCSSTTLPPVTNNSDEVRFIWASEEECGYRHLYLITSQISCNSLISTCDDVMENDYVSPFMIGHINSACLQPKILSKVSLTSGEWEVCGEDIWVNESRKLVYFIGLKETPLEKHLYVVSLDRPGEIRLLTRPGFSYTVDFNRGCTILVTVYSNIEKPPACEVFRITHTDWTVEGVTLTSIGYLLESTTLDNNYFAPDLYSYIIRDSKASTSEICDRKPVGDFNDDLITDMDTSSLLVEQTFDENGLPVPTDENRCATTENTACPPLYAMVFKPHNFQFGVKYPVVLNIYGGPEVQLVSNSFKGMRQLRMHVLAARGYCVIAIDSRGSKHRGLKFEGHIKGRMGTVELGDQIEVIKWLSENLDYIDLSRIAIHGWSYGGYLSLMGLIQHPHVFKVAVAGAPVTNWNLYDTGYTERYMGLPEHNVQGYLDGSVLNHIEKFPDEDNRLLIIHGLIDENVHFYHTSQLINSLIKNGKPYQLQIYPSERHSLRHLDASKHYETTLLSFLQNNL